MDCVVQVIKINLYPIFTFNVPEFLIIQDLILSVQFETHIYTLNILCVCSLLYCCKTIKSKQCVFIKLYFKYTTVRIITQFSQSQASLIGFMHWRIQYGIIFRTTSLSVRVVWGRFDICNKIPIILLQLSQNKNACNGSELVMTMFSKYSYNCFYIVLMLLALAL